MKKTILKMMAVAGIVAVSALSTNAQVSKGTLMFGGSLGASVTMESTQKVTGAADVKTPGYTNWNFSPTVGYFIGDGLALGLSLNVSSNYVYSITTNDGKTTENIMRSGLGVSLFARKYMLITEKVYFHGQGSLGYTSSSFTTRKTVGSSGLADDDKNTISNIGVNITPGLTYFVSPKWGIDFSLNNILAYNMTTRKTETEIAGSTVTTETTGGNFSIGAGLTPTLGLFYYMGK
ncbi:MAG: hypothetical protein ACEQSR_06145 [Candidatus Methylacidiphilales bacterium]